MPISFELASQRITMLSGLPYYQNMLPEAMVSLIQALAAEADSDAMACNALEALRSDVARASSSATNRMPSPGEIRVWIQHEKDKARRYWVSPPEPEFCRKCAGERKVLPDDYPLQFEIDEQESQRMEAAMVPCPWCAK
jgi:hypothetical protein